MNIGFVSVWCNRGQAVVTRRIRSIFDQAGHNTFVLARPINPNLPRGGLIETTGVWAAPNVTHASRWEVPTREYKRWAKANQLDVVFCDMNLQFAEIAALRKMGIRTVGRFVWERFGQRIVPSALKAYDVVYSLTRAEQERYGRMGIESPYLRWGLHPETLRDDPPRPDGRINFFFHGGMQGRRKPIVATVEAFKAVPGDNLRLILKSQSVREVAEQVDVSDDPRIEVIVRDMPQEEYDALLGSAHVTLTPSRWEGLGVHLFESIAMGIPVISSDIPPINEVISNGVSGLLGESHEIERMEAGFAVYEPDREALRGCIEQLADPERLWAMTQSTLRDRERLSWEHTRQDYLAIAERTP